MPRTAPRRVKSAAGAQLRRLREMHGLTMRDVVQLSQMIAKGNRNSRFALSLTVLANIEAGNAVPTIFTLASLADIYDRSISELLSYFGI